MFDGKMLRGETGTPMRITARANISLSLAEPEPLTLAKRTTKSFTRLSGAVVGMTFLRVSFPADKSTCPRHRSGSVRRTGRNAGRRPQPKPKHNQTKNQPTQKKQTKKKTPAP